MADHEEKREREHDILRALAGGGAGGGSGGAADPPSGLDGWWNTPPAHYRRPVAVDPAIHGYDALGEDARDAGHAAPGLRSHVALSAPVMAQAAASAGVAAGTAMGPDPDRVMHAQKAVGGRAHAIAAQLRLAALKLDDVTTRIHAVLNAPADERSAEGVAQQLRGLFDEGRAERERIALVQREQFQDVAIRPAFLQLSRANHQFGDAARRAQARLRGKVAAADLAGVDADGVDHDVVRLESSLQLTGADDTTAGKVTESRRDLEAESLRESLDGVHEGTRALVIAMGEPDPRGAMTAVVPGLLSSVHLLKASLVKGMTATSEMRTTGKKVVANMQKATRDAEGVKLHQDGALVQANAEILTAIKQLDALPKAKP